MKHQIMTVMLDAFLIINALPPPKFLQKNAPPTFSMVHLLHRLYGVDAPATGAVVRITQRSTPELCTNWTFILRE